MPMQGLHWCMCWVHSLCGCTAQGLCIEARALQTLLPGAADNELHTTSVCIVGMSFLLAKSKSPKMPKVGIALDCSHIA